MLWKGRECIYNLFKQYFGMLVFGFFPFIFKELYNPWLEWEVPETPFMGTDNEKERGVLFVGGWFWVFYIKQLVFICLENDKSDLRSNYLIFLCPYPYTYFFLHLISSCVLSFFFFFFSWVTVSPLHFNSVLAAWISDCSFFQLPKSYTLLGEENALPHPECQRNRKEA